MPVQLLYGVPGMLRRLAGGRAPVTIYPQLPLGLASEGCYSERAGIRANFTVSASDALFEAVGRGRVTHEQFVRLSNLAVDQWYELVNLSGRGAFDFVLLSIRSVSNNIYDVEVEVTVDGNQIIDGGSWTLPNVGDNATGIWSTNMVMFPVVGYVRGFNNDTDQGDYDRMTLLQPFQPAIPFHKTLVIRFKVPTITQMSGTVAGLKLGANLWLN